ncbi:MAG: hypothetical protein ACI9MC_001635 [Kiritimatiellia bacterium]|jgi:uncharacterized protein (TIGR03382 family)
MRIPSVVLVLAIAAPASAIAPQGDLRVGPPQMTFERSPSTQMRMSNDPRLRALAQRWGRAWAWRFDEATGRPMSATLPGVPWSQHAELARDIADTLAIRDLEEVAVHHRGERATHTWRQVHDGLPMWGTELAIFAVSGRVHAIRTHLADAPAQPAPAGATLWWRDGKRWVPAIESETDDVVSIHHVDGTLLARWTTRYHSDLTHTYEERAVGDALIAGPLADVTVTDEVGSSITDSKGAHSATDPYDLLMEGDYIRMRDGRQSGWPVPLYKALTGSVEMALKDDMDAAIADTFAHTLIVRNWVADRVSDHPIVETPIVATVNRSNIRCNAYYTSATINFGLAYGRCANTGRLADVIYHEMGHGIHHFGLASGGFAGDLSEGVSDYIAATIVDDPKMGNGFFGPGSTLRNIEPDRVYPDFMVGEVHHDGLIWASFLWNLREQYETDFGDPAGIDMADTLALDAMTFGPSMTTVGDAVIMADDDDGDLSNGTPHACDLVPLLDKHGLGPGPIGVVVFEHEPTELASSWDPSYPLSFDLYDAMPDCSGLDEETIGLWWTIDEVSDEDAIDSFDEVEGAEFTSAGGAVWSRLELSRTESTWSGEVPRQLATTRVTYFMEARSLADTEEDPVERITTHSGFAERLYAFTVGDREQVWCEGFESDVVEGWTHGTGTPWKEGNSKHVDQWAFGTPSGESLWDAPEAFEGTKVAGTVIAGNGMYRNLNSQYLQSPVVDIPEDGRMLTLSWRRWLTVEDSKFDKSRVYFEDEPVWVQPGTEAGGDHTLDRRWILREHDMSERAGGSVQVTWTLSSDPGLEFGGWTLDRVCVERLDDVPGHHRIRDLAATSDEPTVPLTWTSPWIAPLEEVVVVRKLGSAPTGLDDGVWVHHDTEPAPGESVDVVDEAVEPCQTWHYAVFYKGGGEWYEGVVDGENATSASTACSTPEDPTPPDPLELPDQSLGGVDAWQAPESVGCTCTSHGSTPSYFGLSLILAIALRRRRRR